MFCSELVFCIIMCFVLCDAYIYWYIPEFQRESRAGDIVAFSWNLTCLSEDCAGTIPVTGLEVVLEDWEVTSLSWDALWCFLKH